jgi:subtilisin family serine protease
MEVSVNSAPESAFADPNSPNPWGLRRISQPDGLAPAFQSCGADGTGVTVVVIDSGINPDHTEFAGRIKRMENFYPGPDANGGRDITGHGTHVAGCAAGATTGVAPGASIVSLAVTDRQDRSRNSNIVAALNWVLMPGNVQLPAVVNMSLSGQHSGAQSAVALHSKAAIDRICFNRSIVFFF